MGAGSKTKESKIKETKSKEVGMATENIRNSGSKISKSKNVTAECRSRF